MNLFRSLTDPKSNRRRVFRGLLLMSLAAGAIPARADQTIVLPPAIPGDLRPVLVLGGVESAKPQSSKDSVVTQRLVKQETPVAVPSASPASKPQLVRPSVPALKIQPAIIASESPEASAFLRGLGAPGMDPLVHYAQDAADPDKLLASPMIKRLLELMEQNTELKAQLKIQEIQMEAKARTHELESALRSQEERAKQAAESLHDKLHQLELQRNEMKQIEQKLDFQRKALEQQRDELHHRAAIHKEQGEAKANRKDAAAESAEVKHQRIEVRVIGKEEAKAHLAELQLEAKQPAGSKEAHGGNLTQSDHTKLAAELREMAEKLAKSEAAFKEAIVSKETLAKRLAELEHRSRLLEEKAKALAEEKNSETNNQRSMAEKRLREREEVRQQEIAERKEQADQRAVEEKKRAEAKLKEQKTKEEAKELEGREKESEKKDKKRDGDENQ